MKTGVCIRYQGQLYWLSGGHWRGKDGHSVHLLTWITDDLLRQAGGKIEGGDLALARRVADRLGVQARDVGGGPD